MSREILFKAKRKNWRELPKEEWWVEGYFTKGKWYMDEREVYAILPTDLCFYPHCEISEWIEIAPETLCQYTGRTDESGKKIWENDIIGFMDITSTESGYSEHDCIGKVGWEDEELCFYVTGRLSAESWEVLQDCVVLGNIFDNPELLE